MIVTAQHFEKPKSLSDIRLLFKQSISNIEISISSYCNRVCDYCPNSIVDRRSKKNIINEEVFSNIINQLAEIDYSNTISLHRYNEPLEDLDFALHKITEVRYALPRSYIDIFTNGDYLNSDAISKLQASGVSRLNVTTHALKDDISFDAVKLRQEKRLKQIGLKYSYYPEVPLGRMARIHNGRGMVIDWWAKNFFDDNNRFDRAQSLEVSQFKRLSPCLFPFKQLQIEWDGQVALCCNIHLDVKGNEEFVLGKIDKHTNIYELWMNEKFIEWRRRLINFDPKGGPCASCQTGCIEGLEEAFDHPKKPDIKQSLRKAIKKLVTLN